VTNGENPTEIDDYKIDDAKCWSSSISGFTMKTVHGRGTIGTRWINSKRRA
jgi:hypothetical protein